MFTPVCLCVCACICMSACKDDIGQTALQIFMCFFYILLNGVYHDLCQMSDQV